MRCRVSRLAGALLIVLLAVMLSGCMKSLSSREYLEVRNSLEVERVFLTAAMWPQYRYFYVGPAGEPIALLALDRRYGLDSQFWTEFTDNEKQLRSWITHFNQIFNDYDDIENIILRYRGSELLSPAGERIGMFYSRHYWIPVWRGEGNLLVIPPPEPSGSQRAPRLRRGGRW